MSFFLFFGLAVSQPKNAEVLLPVQLSIPHHIHVHCLPRFYITTKFQYLKSFFNKILSLESIMDIEKRYQDEGHEETEVRDSRSISEEYDSLMTGIQTLPPAAGMKKKFSRIMPIFLLLSLTSNLFQIAYTLSKRPSCVSLYGMCSRWEYKAVS